MPLTKGAESVSHYGSEPRRSAMIHQAASLLHLPRLCAKRSVRPAARRVYDATDRIDDDLRN
jgi:hypothetical protein